MINGYGRISYGDLSRRYSDIEDKFIRNEIRKLLKEEGLQEDFADIDDVFEMNALLSTIGYAFTLERTMDQVYYEATLSRIISRVRFDYKVKLVDDPIYEAVNEV